MKSPDPDLGLNLAAVFAAAYQRGRYARRLRYDQPLRPPLGSQDAAWVDPIARDRAAK